MGNTMAKSDFQTVTIMVDLVEREARKERNKAQLGAPATHSRWGREWREEMEGGAYIK